MSTRDDTPVAVDPTRRAILAALVDLEADVTRLGLKWRPIPIPEHEDDLAVIQQAEDALRFVGLGQQADKARAIYNAAQLRLICRDIYSPQFGHSATGGHRTGD